MQRQNPHKILDQKGKKKLNLEANNQNLSEFVF
jgi:hypothetical protein